MQEQNTTIGTQQEITIQGINKNPKQEYQEIYNTTTRLNTDLGNMQSLPENDKMFEQFSKAQRINTIKTQLNRWVEDYNAKSKMWGKSLWKSQSLPYQLDVNQFSNYNK